MSKRRKALFLENWRKNMECERMDPRETEEHVAKCKRKEKSKRRKALFLENWRQNMECKMMNYMNPDGLRERKRR